MKNKGSIAILGGMGPQASAKLLEVLFDVCVKDFGAKSDSDFPEVILNSVPVPNFISDRKNSEFALKILEKRVKKLESFNPVCFGISCNTAHVLLDNLQSKTNVPFVSIIDEVAKKVTDSKIKKIGLLGTPVTIDSALYQNALKKQKIEIIVPSRERSKIVEDIVRKVLRGKADVKDAQQLSKVAKSLKRNGAQGIILGCTELPLIFSKTFPMLVFDSIEILAKGLLRKFFETDLKNN
ncbi:MAG: hypothetical protein A3C30_01930 [Candidatus Levybacteria bacterium RIFCSPHIGHO2_02_FULL_40_18]|nr:MAG: hypothetical protein A2869_04310 [Candidatus Levybacteria bacterium RIFCSPHIGHO2_01_FULL_40_58]OGH26750.1 MAG: hypothetical protein A3C30_01930 [Candidatus Levybacteria bacterium RIFCSPHIGHO2_02_FULL_40_18]OGH31685.1 MAG: hypothetical protein A3E43_01650 [Candidatus Levybacteria bacterium RIFCSPHIGHO2_12_FULL_40_31]OGH40585.1 MAG: hypothetical protein A2894_00200 [Candidatus Levybacteria bacterium RIFCSPLOWO2_01_FULL_40_64]OGH53304.1 MAG: hypothetical protein A3G15_04765 [Candidatus Lev